MNGSQGSLSILTVCDGNVCRSAAAQFEIGTRMPRARVESAGLRARPGALLCDLVAAGINTEDSADPDFARTFRSRRIDEVVVGDFNLVLAATTSVRSDLARAHPELRDRFFTLREAADVLTALREGGGPSERFTPTSLVEGMNRQRGARATTSFPSRTRLRNVEPLDIPDAHGRRGKRHPAVVAMARSSALSVGESLALLLAE